MSQRKSRPENPSEATGPRRGAGRSDSAEGPRTPRQREVSTVSATADARRDQLGNRRQGVRQTRPRGNVQSPREANRTREASVYSEARASPPGAPPPARTGRYRTRQPERGAAMSRPPRPREISEVSVYADAPGTGPGRRRATWRGRHRPGRAPPPPLRPREISTVSVYADASDAQGQGRDRQVSRELRDIRRSTRQTSQSKSDKPWFQELSKTSLLVIVITWLPRFFFPWITNWHEYDFYILVDPSHLHDERLLQVRIYVLVAKSAITIVLSVLADVIRLQFDQKYYIYLALLALFNLSPIFGGYAATALTARLLDDHPFYDKNWFASTVMMKCALSVSFIMFPVQMACIYAQNDHISRNGHSTWISIFVGVELFNAYVAFVVIPGDCPTTFGTQRVFWNLIGPLLAVTSMMTVTIFFSVDDVKDVLLCHKKKSSYTHKIGFLSRLLLSKTNPPVIQKVRQQSLDTPADLTQKKLLLFVALSLPLVSAYFSFGVLEHFVPEDDWNDHFSSALGVFIGAKILGVILIALVMILVRRGYKKDPTILKTEMFYLGLPHILFIVGLLLMVIRFTLLAYPKIGDVIIGPIPSNDKSVFVFVNSVFTNRTVCVRSNYFKPFKIRPQQFASKAVYGEVNTIDMTVEVDPEASEVDRTPLRVENISSGQWMIFDMALLSSNVAGLNEKEYESKVFAYRLNGGLESIRPQVGATQLVIFQVLIPLEIPGYPWYYLLKNPALDSVQIPAPNKAGTSLGFDRIAAVWDVPVVGNWTAQIWTGAYDISEHAHAWVLNAVQRTYPLEFELENNSVYLLMEYFYEEAHPFHVDFKRFVNHTEGQRYQGFPLKYNIYRFAKLARPGSHYIPNNEQIQCDLIIRFSMIFAGLAAGGIFVGFVYMFWVDSPMPKYRTIILAAFWVLMGIAYEIPRIIPIRVDLMISIVLLVLQFVMTALHFIGSFFMFVPKYDFHITF